MKNSNDPGAAEQITPHLSSFEIYVWAINGPFKTGHESAMTIAKTILAINGEERLRCVENGILSHEEKYNQNREEWEGWRKNFIRKNLYNIGGERANEIKEAEVKIQKSGYHQPCIQHISSLLSGNDNEAEEDTSQCFYSQTENATNFSHAPLQRKEKEKVEDTDDIFDKIGGAFMKVEDKDDIFDKIGGAFMTATGALTRLIYVVIFFSAWGALIAGNLILGLAFGWIPALIVTFMAMIFAPLVVLLSALLLLAIAVLIGWLIYNSFI